MHSTQSEVRNEHPTPILVVDDDAITRELLRATLLTSGYSVDLAQNGKQALELIGQREYAVVLSDVQMAPLNGMEILSDLRARGSQAVPVLMTGHGSLQGTVAAIHNGAFDFLSKPLRPETVLQTVRRAIGHWEGKRRKNEKVTPPLAPTPLLVGRSPQMVEVYRSTALAALNESTVLIGGESGTGKELVARAIYQYSLRKDLPFITVNCAALSDNLLESELFGHVKGAFTGAISGKTGLFDEADKGTIFLDEIGDISPAMQVGLLRVLQSGEVKPVGSNSTHQVDVRVIAATHRDLEAKVADGSFREDLYYRLKVVSIELPPLRRRPQDIEPFVRFFLQKLTAGTSRGKVEVSPEAMSLLEEYQWPGNVRELEHAVEHALAMTPACVLFPEDFPILTAAAAKAPEGLAPLSSSEKGTLLSLDEVELAHIQRILKIVGFNKSKAAEVLGIDRATLYRKAQKYGIALGQKSDVQV